MLIGTFVLVVSRERCLNNEAAEFTKGLAMLWMDSTRGLEDHTPIPDTGLILAEVEHCEGVRRGSEVWHTIL